MDVSITRIETSISKIDKYLRMIARMDQIIKDLENEAVISEEIRDWSTAVSDFMGHISDEKDIILREIGFIKEIISP